MDNLDRLKYASYGLLTSLALGALLILTVNAFAYSKNVKDNCTNDYFAHCSHTTPYSNEMRQCMGKAGERRLLTKACLSALKSSGEVSRWQRARN